MTFKSLDDATEKMLEALEYDRAKAPYFKTALRELIRIENGFAIFFDHKLPIKKSHILPHVIEEI